MCQKVTSYWSLVEIKSWSGTISKFSSNSRKDQFSTWSAFWHRMKSSWCEKLSWKSEKKNKIKKRSSFDLCQYSEIKSWLLRWDAHAIMVAFHSYNQLMIKRIASIPVSFYLCAKERDRYASILLIISGMRIAHVFNKYEVQLFFENIQSAVRHNSYFLIILIYAAL